MIETRVNLHKLKTGHTKSCGCHKIAVAGKHTKGKAYASTHGLCNKRKLLKCWHNMRSRCENPLSRDWKWYGGKGVSICPAWTDFTTFCTWAEANGYKEGLSIDRLDSEGNYEPSNCEWVTVSENTQRMHEAKGTWVCKA